VARRLRPAAVSDVLVVALALPAVSFMASRGAPEVTWVTDVLLVVATLVWARLRRLSRADVGLGLGDVRLTFVVSGTALALATSACVVASSFIGATPEVPGGSTTTTGELLRVFAITAAAEETIYRGAFLGVSAVKLRPAQAVAIQAVSFGLWHVGPSMSELGIDDVGDVGGITLRVVATALAAIPLTCIRMKCRSIVPVVALHGGVSASVLFISGL
jgi:membrane protease YdiL (CAAX protease family)